LGGAVIFFGVLGFFLAKKLNDPAPGIVVTAEGFTDNSSGLTGTVRWADVTGLEELTLMGQKLLVKLRNPADYIAKQSNPFKRQLMQTNLKSYGSPITISANALECTYDELKALLASCWQARPAQVQTAG
jgi:hypothetical protein